MTVQHTSSTDRDDHACGDDHASAPADAAAAAAGSERVMGRRTALRTLGGAAVAGSALGAASTNARAQSDGTDLESWFENTSNYDGVVDRTDSDAVSVGVGVDANGGAFGFGPAAIRITPGTTVTWEWTGDGGSHNVVATDGSFESDLVDSAGHTFEHTFESEGTSTYSCTPHETMGMKGAVVVGGGSGGSGSGGGGSGGSGSGGGGSGGSGSGGGGSGGSGSGGGGDGSDSGGSDGNEPEQVAAPFGDPGARRLGGLVLGGVFAVALASPGLFGVFLRLTDRSDAGSTGEESAE